MENVRSKISGLQEALECAIGEQGNLERRLAIAARQHKADLSDAQLQIQARHSCQCIHSALTLHCSL